VVAKKLLGACAFFSIVSLGVVGCASYADDADEDMESSESELNARKVSLKYEGTCEFLRNCSSYSKSLPAGKVNWGCTGVGACSDSGKWVAGPNRSYCGKTVQICKGSKCTNAVVKDVSVTRDWEASNGVLSALGLPYGLSGRCSGYGGGSVTISTVGGKSSTRSLSIDDAMVEDDDET
jgi:hypothetical protein